MGNLLADAKLHWKFFNQYFCDAACCALDASELAPDTRDNQERIKRYTRSCIVHCSLALESAANCCLDMLQLQRASHEDFDKLTTLAKFDVFLSHIKPRTHLDREHNLVRPIRNLISCRNQYVHSKVMTEDVKHGHLTPNIWEPLGLPHNTSYWTPIHAVKTFTVLSDFLNYFFFEACGYSYEGYDGRTIALRILSSGIGGIDGQKLPGGVEFSVVRDEYWGHCLKAAKKWDLEFAFLGVSSTGLNNEQIYPKRKWGDYSHCEVGEVTIPWQPIVYPVPTGLGIVMVGSSFPQKNRKSATEKAKARHLSKSEGAVGADEKSPPNT